MGSAGEHGGPGRLGRLRWLCRRGMKELDLVLEGFLLRESAALEDGAWPELEAFLDTEDDQLWDWVLGRGEPDKEQWREILAELRH